MPERFALLTVTYRGDIGPFEQLCASIDRHMPDIDHYVLVDNSDVALFARFASCRRHLINCRERLPQLHEFQLLGKRLWWKFPATIIRGWIYQQLAKITVAASLTEEAVIVVDSDAVFIRPIEHDQIFRKDGAVSLYHRPGAPSGPASESPKWHNAALQALGLPQRGYTGADYISTAVVWSPAVVRAMIARIESTGKRSWIAALTRHYRFSEYVTYGVFCEHVAGDHATKVAVTDRELCHCSWHYDLDAEEGRQAFRAALQPHHVAVLVQSNLKMEEQRRAGILATFEA